MNLFYLSILLAVVANIFYHIFQKSITGNVNPLISLIITYGTALAISLAIFFVDPGKKGFLMSLKEANWASYALGVAVIGLEMGFLLAYREGWNVSLAALLTNSLVALSLIPVGILFYHEHLSLVNLVGVMLSMAGLVLVNL